LLSDTLNKIGKEIIKAMQKDIADSSGHLSKSFKFQVSRGNYLSYSLEFEMLKYGVYLDKGTNPHMPPVNSLRKWAAKKGLNVWAVAMSIKKYGTKPHPFIHNFADVIRANKIQIEKALGFEIKEKIKGQWQ